MSETPPDRLAINPQSPFHDAAALERGVGVRFNGIERDDVEEYSVSEGWIRVQAGRSRDRRGNPMTSRSRARSRPTSCRRRNSNPGAGTRAVPAAHDRRR
jgi:Protein of unknown function (DUF3297).